MSAGIQRYFFALLFSISNAYAQDTVIIKGMPGGMIPEVIIQQSESQVAPIKPPPQITTQKFSKKNLSRLAKSLIFVDTDPEKCKIIEMDVRSGATNVLFQPKLCFPRLIVFSSTKFILVYHDAIQDISLIPALKAGPIIKHPKPLSRKNTTLSKYSYAGYDAKGKLTLMMASTYPWDDEYGFFYKYRSGNWVLVREKKCLKFEWCGHDEIEPKRGNAFFWGEELNVWHEKQKENPYITQRKVTPVKNWQDGDQSIELTFGFSGRKSVLSVYTRRGGDADTPIAFGVKLKVQAKEEIELADGQSRAYLMGKYLLKYGYAQELYDLETGEVIRELFDSAWVYE